MPMHEPSLRLMDTLLNSETQTVLSCSLAPLVIGALSQVEATIDLTNRVCDRYIIFQTRKTLDRAPSSGTQTNLTFR